MPTQYLSDDIGALDDSIALVLNGDKVITAETWEVTEGILSQPASFSMQLGWGGVAQELLQKYPKGTKFELYVGNVLQATGRTDGVEANQSPGGAMTVHIFGRDPMARLHDTYVKAATGVNVQTYALLVKFALNKCGLVNVDLKASNAANRRLKSGVPVVETQPHRTVEEILADAGQNAPSAGVVHNPPQAKLNETWMQFVHRYIDRAGLMLWASGDGGFVLSSPDADQAPTYTLRRDPFNLPPTSGTGANVIGVHYKDDAAHRHSEAVVYGRGGGKVLGRVKAKGGFTDQEMLDAGYKDQPIVFRDVHVTSGAEASYFARRKLAEERRAGWVLEYTIAGLTLPYLGGGSDQTRAVVVPDTVVDVQDAELGINGHFYVETVIRRRSPQTTTTIRLMRTTDLVFGGPDESEGG